MVEMRIKEDKLTLTIFNGMGQKVKNYNLTVENQRTNVVLEDLESGVYYIQIQGTETIYGFEKVILVK